MSKVFNMVGGGGGKNISSIIITGLESTDTITCTKDGKSYIATWDDTDRKWEIVGLPLGTFTVTATNGTKTTTETVFIDIAGVYEIEMSYKLYLYRNGDECEDVTGGWTNDGYTDNLEVLLGEKRSTSMYMTHGPANGYTLLGTNNKIDFSGFTKLYFEIISIAGSGNKGIRLSSQKGSFWNNQEFYKEDYNATGVFSVSLSNLTSDYIIFYVFGGNTIEISKVWLE